MSVETALIDRLLDAAARVSERIATWDRTETGVSESVDGLTLAEVLWLGRFLPPPGASAEESVRSSAPLEASTSVGHTSDDVEPNPEVPPATTNRSTPPASSVLERPASSGATKRARDIARSAYLPDSGGTSRDAGQVTVESFLAPDPPAVPRLREIALGLRPFKRETEDSATVQLAEEATAERWSELALSSLRRAVRHPLIPKMIPGSRRALSLLLLIDISPSMVLWKEMADEMVGMLRCHGAFRDVRTFFLDAHGEVPHLLSAAPDRQADAHELSENTLPIHVGETLLVTITDGLSTAWKNSASIDLMGRLARKVPVTIWHALPTSLWYRGCFGTPRWQATSRGPLTNNTEIILCSRQGTPRRRTDEGASLADSVPLPVIPIQEQFIRHWARLSMGLSHLSVPAVRILSSMPPDAGSVRSEPLIPLTIEKVVEDFLRQSSPTLQRFTQLVAALPLSPPVLRWVRRTYLPDAGHGLLAEFLLSPLVEPVGASGALFAFRTGVSDLLLRSTPVSDTLAILKEIGDALGLSDDTQRRFAAYQDVRRDVTAGTSVAIASESTRPTDGTVIPLARRFALLGGAAMESLGISMPNTGEDTAMLRVRFDTGDNPVARMAWSPDGALLVAAVKPHNVAVWSRDGTRLWHVSLSQYEINDVAWTRGGREILTVGFDRRLRWLDRRTGNVLQTSRAHNSDVRAVAIAGEYVVTGTNGGTIRFFSNRRPNPDYLLFMQIGSIWMLAGRPRTVRPTLAVAGERALVEVNLADGLIQVIQQWTFPETHATSVGYSPDGSTLFAGCANGMVYAIDRMEGENFTPVAFPAAPSRHMERITTVTCSNSGTNLVTRSADGVTQLWTIPPTSNWQFPHWQDAIVAEKNVNDFDSRAMAGAVFHPAYDLLAIPCAQDCGIACINVSGSEDQRQLFPYVQVRLRHDGSVIFRLAWSPDGNWLAVPTVRGNIYLWARHQWEFPDDSPPIVLHDTDNGVNQIAWSPDARFFAAACYDQQCRVYSVAEQRLLWQVDCGGDVRSVTWFPRSDRIVAVTANASIVVIDAISRSHRVDHATPSLNVVACVGGEDSKWSLAVGGEKGFAAVLDSETTEILTLPGKVTGQVTAISGSPNGLLAVGTTRHEVSLFQLLPSGGIKRTYDLATHNDVVSALAFSPDGSKLATRSMDGETILWEVSTGTLIEQFRSSRSNFILSGLGFDPSGELLAVPTEGDTILEIRAKATRTSNAHTLETLRVLGIEISPSPNRDHLTTTLRTRGAVVTWHNISHDNIAETLLHVLKGEYDVLLADEPIHLAVPLAQALREHERAVPLLFLTVDRMDSGRDAALNEGTAAVVHQTRDAVAALEAIWKVSENGGHYTEGGIRSLIALRERLRADSGTILATLLASATVQDPGNSWVVVSPHNITYVCDDRIKRNSTDIIPWQISLNNGYPIWIEALKEPSSAGTTESHVNVGSESALLTARYSKTLHPNSAKLEQHLREQVLDNARPGLRGTLFRTLLLLGEEYAAIRRRRAASRERTKLMTEIVSQMTEVCKATQPSVLRPLLTEIISSVRAANRLIAVIILGITKDSEYLNWLRERFEPNRESAFVRYHTAVTLATIAGTVSTVQLPAVDEVISTVLNRERPEKDRDTHRQLLQAKQIIASRGSLVDMTVDRQPPIPVDRTRPTEPQRKSTSISSPPVRARHAVIIGVDKTIAGGDFPSLSYASHDAQTLSDTIRSADFTSVQVLINAEATLHAVKAALEYAIETSESDDLLWVHFSGFGLLLESGVWDKQPYLVMYDTEPSHISTSALSVKMLDALLRSTTGVRNATLPPRVLVTFDIGLPHFVGHAAEAMGDIAFIGADISPDPVKQTDQLTAVIVETLKTALPYNSATSPAPTIIAANLTEGLTVRALTESVRARLLGNRWLVQTPFHFDDLVIIPFSSREGANETSEEDQSLYSTFPLSGQLDGMRILWVEDTPSANLDAMQRVLRRAGATVTWYSALDFSISILNKQTFDAVLSDLSDAQGRYGQPYGILLAKNLKKVGCFAHVLLLTNSIPGAYLEASDEAGVELVTDSFDAIVQKLFALHDDISVPIAPQSSLKQSIRKVFSDLTVDDIDDIIQDATAEIYEQQSRQSSHNTQQELTTLIQQQALYFALWHSRKQRRAFLKALDGTLGSNNRVALLLTRLPGLPEHFSSSRQTSGSYQLLDELITWTGKNGRHSDLLTAALSVAPNNASKLHSLTQKLGIFVHDVPLEAVEQKELLARRENFLHKGSWENVLKFGEWQWGASNPQDQTRIIGSGINNFVLSKNNYGVRPFFITCKLRFYDYAKFAIRGSTTANAGIVIGLDDESIPHYYNILFTGTKISLEEVGVARKENDIRESVPGVPYRHLSLAMPFVITEGNEYSILVKVGLNTINVLIDDQEVASFETPQILDGRVGLRPWRSKIECTQFEVEEE